MGVGALLVLKLKKNRAPTGTQRQRALNTMPPRPMCVATLSLRHFILKQRVLSFYRTAIRASRGHHLLIFALFFLLKLSPSQSLPTLQREKKRSHGSEQNWKGISILRTWCVKNFLSSPTFTHSCPQELIEARLRASRRELGQLLTYRSEPYPPP